MARKGDNKNFCAKFHGKLQLKQTLIYDKRIPIGFICCKSQLMEAWNTNRLDEGKSLLISRKLSETSPLTSRVFVYFLLHKNC